MAKFEPEVHVKKRTILGWIYKTAWDNELRNMGALVLSLTFYCTVQASGNVTTQIFNPGDY